LSPRRRYKLTGVKITGLRMRRLLVPGAAAAILMVSMVACADEPRVKLIGPGGDVRAIVRVEIADNSASRELGLMYRKHLDEDAGMIFVFKEPQHLSFWMKNTEIPLDMIFAAPDGRIVGLVENAHPFSEQNLAVEGDSQYVLEVNGGFCKRHEIKAGDTMKFSGFVARARN
jgi:uncharacterized membrane protein (UPF0127 family)